MSMKAIMGYKDALLLNTVDKEMLENIIQELLIKNPNVDEFSGYSKGLLKGYIEIIKTSSRPIPHVSSLLDEFINGDISSPELKLKKKVSPTLDLTMIELIQDYISFVN